MIGNIPFQRILFFAGVGTAILGVYAASQVNPVFEWDSIAAMIIIGVGFFMTIVGLLAILHEDVTRPPEGERTVLPENMVPLVYGGFIMAVSFVPALVVGHYIGRNEGFITFIFAFVVSNVFFGLGLLLGRQPSYR